VGFWGELVVVVEGGAICSPRGVYMIWRILRDSRQGDRELKSWKKLSVAWKPLSWFTPVTDKTF